MKIQADIEQLEKFVLAALTGLCAGERYMASMGVENQYTQIAKRALTYGKEAQAQFNHYAQKL